MKIIKILVLFITVNGFSQTLEKNENLKKFHKVELISDSWKINFKLNNGRVVKRENYLKKRLRQRVIFIHDTILNITTEIEKYNANDGKSNDTLKFIYTWNRANQLIEKTDEFGNKEVYSDFDSRGLPKIIERKGSSFDSIAGYRAEYNYDSNGNILNEKLFSKIDNKIFIEINDYKYDQYNNIVEVNRNSNPKQTYPITITGGRDRYQNEKYRYVYNKYGLWTEQYWIVEDKEFLIYRRKFK